MQRTITNLSDAQSPTDLAEHGEAPGPEGIVSAWQQVRVFTGDLVEVVVINTKAPGAIFLPDQNSGLLDFLLSCRPLS